VSNPRPTVSRTGRLLDVAGLVLMLGGAGCYLRAFAGMRALQRRPRVPGDVPFAAMAEFERWWNLSRLGGAVFLAGVVIAVTAAIVAHRQRAAIERVVAVA
jgi:hypothetical protein